MSPLPLGGIWSDRACRPGGQGLKLTGCRLFRWFSNESHKATSGITVNLLTDCRHFANNLSDKRLTILLVDRVDNGQIGIERYLWGQLTGEVEGG